MKAKNPMGSAQMAAVLEVRGKIQKWDLGISGISDTETMNMEEVLMGKA